MNDRIVINASPLIALGKMGLFDIVREMEIALVAPLQVEQELKAGNRHGHLIDFPEWIEVLELDQSADPRLFGRLDSGEAAVIQPCSRNQKQYSLP